MSREILEELNNLVRDENKYLEQIKSMMESGRSESEIMEVTKKVDILHARQKELFELIEELKAKVEENKKSNVKIVPVRERKLPTVLSYSVIIAFIVYIFYLWSKNA